MICRTLLSLSIIINAVAPQGWAALGARIEEGSASRPTLQHATNVGMSGGDELIELKGFGADVQDVDDGASLALTPDARVVEAIGGSNASDARLAAPAVKSEASASAREQRTTFGALNMLSTELQKTPNVVSSISGAIGHAFEDSVLRADGVQGGTPAGTHSDGPSGAAPPGGDDSKDDKPKLVLPTQAPIFSFTKELVKLFPRDNPTLLLQMDLAGRAAAFEERHGRWAVFAPADAFAKGAGVSVGGLALVKEVRPPAEGAEKKQHEVDLEGVALVKITSISKDEHETEIAHVEPLTTPDGDLENIAALVGIIKDGLREIVAADNVDEKYQAAVRRTFSEIKGSESALEVSLILGKNYSFDSYTDQQQYLLAPSVEVRLEDMARRITDIATKIKTTNARKEKMQKSIREQVLRSDLAAIQKELGESGEEDVAAELEAALKAAEVPEPQATLLRKDIRRLKGLSEGSGERGMLAARLQKIIELPWNKRKKIDADIARLRRILKEDHSGLDKVVDRIVEYVAVYLHNLEVNPDAAFKGKTLCFVGPPGVGKTSLGQSIARALDLPFERVPLGGINDPAEIRGHRKTYMGSDFGQLLKAISKQGVKNGVLMFDEIDKMKPGIQGDPNAVMLEALDPEQNFAFKDNYAEVAFDISETFKIATANSLEDIPAPLRDRMEIIRLDGYDVEQKVEIAQRHLIPKKLKELGISTRFDEAAIREIIDHYTLEAGVRLLEQRIESVLRKFVVALTEKKKPVPSRVTKAKVVKLLDKRRKDDVTPENGIALGTGLWVNDMGGSGTLSVEMLVLPGGTGNIHVKLSGRLQETMQESAELAFDWVRANHRRLGIPLRLLKQNDFHIHVPDGATPKDGPSAGAIFATTIVSALTGRPIKKGLAMTGEMTGRGAITGIGGLKSKTLAAEREGMTQVLYPASNEDQLEDLPARTRAKVQLTPVTNIWQVLKIALDLEPVGPWDQFVNGVRSVVPFVFPEYWQGKALSPASPS